MIVNYNCNRSFIVLATVIMILNYDRKTFIVQAPGVNVTKLYFLMFFLRNNKLERLSPKTFFRLGKYP
jgi:hypothetical protein